MHRYMHVALLKPTSTCNQLSLFSWLLAVNEWSQMDTSLQTCGNDNIALARK